MRARTRLCLASLLLGTATLTACGGTTPQSGSGGSATSTAEVGSGAPAPAAGGGQTVTIYSADGLGDWYKKEFADFTAQTSIKVQYVQAGSGEVVSRIAKEKSNPQADVVVTLPPFIQQAKKNGDLEPNAIPTDGVPAQKRDADGTWVPLVDNYFAMIRTKGLNTAPTSWNDLLASTYADKIQYSTPGQAGDGTGMLVLLQQVMGKQEALDYLGKLQTNNVGPSSSTGKLGPKVSKGELSVANSDLQMAQLAIKNDKVNYETWFPSGTDGKKATISLPYAMGVVKAGPHQENGKKLAQFLMSKDVQQAIPDAAMGLPARTDVTPSGPNVTLLNNAIKGVEVLQPNWDEVYASLPENLAAYQKAVGQ